MPRTPQRNSPVAIAKAQGSGSKANLISALESQLGEIDAGKIALSLINAAKRGDLRAAQMVLEHLSGKPATREDIAEDVSTEFAERLKRASARLQAMHSPCANCAYCACPDCRPTGTATTTERTEVSDE